MHNFLKKVIAYNILLAWVFSLAFVGVALARAATINGFNVQLSADGSGVITWAPLADVGTYSVGISRPYSEGANKYCISTDFKWVQSTVQASVSVSGLPLTGEELCVRVFPGGDANPGTDYFFNAYKSNTLPVTNPVVTSTPVVNPFTPTPTPTTPTPTTPTPTLPTQTPIVEPTSTPVAGGSLVAIWANDGGDKITRDEHRATTNAVSVHNTVWDGQKIKIFGAKNEVVNFNTILETGSDGARNVTFVFDTLAGPNGAMIKSVPTTGNGVFNWQNRDIELFYIKYLPIKGLSRLSYETYDERHIPARFQRPYTGEGIGTGSWLNRPDHDKFYPEIMVPLELNPTFDISANQNQSIWADVYIPKLATVGLYTGTVTIKENGGIAKQIPVELTVRDFILPDMPTAKTMVAYSKGDLNERILGTAQKWPAHGSSEDLVSDTVQNRLFQLAHRHKISLIDDGINDDSPVINVDQPAQVWVPRLNGSLFTAVNGYRGPGEGVGNNVYSIGTYGGWSWQNGTQVEMQKHADTWMNWFNINAPNTETFLYLIDESNDYPSIQKWSQWTDSAGTGKYLKTFATISLPDAVKNTSALDIAASWFTVGDTATWQNAVNSWKSQPGKSLYMYNGKRPSNGSFATEDDGVALRELAWAQYKKNIDRWFFWNGTYYNDYQGGRGQTNVFQTAQTFGGAPSNDSVVGQNGWNYSNGDGVLFYPGTDKLFPDDSYNAQGVFASLRLKEWRRGLQDVDYLALANKVDPIKTKAILDKMVPKALWDYGVANMSDPTWVRANISWSIDPNNWEEARQELAGIIESKPISSIVDMTRVLQMHFDENASVANFIDAGFYRNDGVCVGFVCPINMNGQLNGAMKFDGKDDRVVIADSDSIDLNKNLSIDVWVYPTATGVYKTIIAKRNTYYLALSNLKPAVYLNGLNKPGWHLANKTLPLNVWSHITVTYDGVNLKIYINGALDRTVTGLIGAIGANNNPLWIGMRDDYITGTSYRFTGGLDELSIYNRVLTGAEIK